MDFRQLNEWNFGNYMSGISGTKLVEFRELNDGISGTRSQTLSAVLRSLINSIGTIFELRPNWFRQISVLQFQCSML